MSKIIPALQIDMNQMDREKAQKRAQAQAERLADTVNIDLEPWHAEMIGEQVPDPVELERLLGYAMVIAVGIRSLKGLWSRA
ncbi:MAG: hypothetical protein WBG50_02220 [Desulfomonilaceae bacterium]